MLVDVGYLSSTELTIDLNVPLTEACLAEVSAWAAREWWWSTVPVCHWPQCGICGGAGRLVFLDSAPSEPVSCTSEVA
jgi:hypothetical protein